MKKIPDGGYLCTEKTSYTDGTASFFVVPKTCFWNNGIGETSAYRVGEEFPSHF
ncbi:hypothetical protein Desor_3900 [Desulfosporosinus orientis DSM 765]|uniref:Uncharacterized protein n=2 Tax=Desulfosporosinus orientis TaxID=1563 RepID=G7WBU9_DESOD|nr:hypothetical protein Desor_3900 [Desulfosporosinus orientis DSM 765]